MLLNTQDANLTKGIRASRNGPHVNHLFFADDALIFIRNNKKVVEAFMRIIKDFMHVLGQQLNLDKSMVFFSQKIPMDQRRVLGNMLCMKVVESLDNYLGLPLHIRKKSQKLLKASLTDSHAESLASVKGSSSMGEEKFSLNLFYNPCLLMLFLGMIEEMQAKMRRMWWMSKDKG
ncbi:reverse transcriptase [Gossypium australe]|uniref:Reverse transcriptase n=1 Tax=Gossypium australe TaxID=47621 RepID=A0A5B6WRN9_9ROSI|nr:reverse transcriptase [Gossypium australe]